MIVRREDQLLCMEMGVYSLSHLSNAVLQRRIYSLAILLGVAHESCVNVTSHRARPVALDTCHTWVNDIEMCHGDLSIQ